MSLTEKLAELSELFIALGVVVVILFIVSWLFSKSSSASPSRQTVKDAASSIPSPAVHAKIEAMGDPVSPNVAALYISPSAGNQMERVSQIEAVKGQGLFGDRYFKKSGHWSGTDDCEVTIIAQEDIDEIEKKSGVQVQNGEHRRNIISQNLNLDSLIGKRFFIGSACFGYERPRPPCAYIQLITEPGMAKALGRHAGIGIRCIKSGTLKEGDQISILQIPLWDALKFRANLIINEWRPRQHSSL
jgi:MOSC domain-containing protein YiiM